MTRILPVTLTGLMVLACTGAATETPPPDPAPVAAPEPDPAPRGGKAGKRKAGRTGDPATEDPQSRIPATGTPDPLAGLAAAEICRSDTLLMVKYSFEELQGGKCNEVCCVDSAKEEHWCCSLDWPFSDVPGCDSYAFMRNGIFARYGYPFTEQRWKDEFGDDPYYRRRDDFDATWLTSVAKKNIDTLKSKEDKHEGCTP